MYYDEDSILDIARETVHAKGYVIYADFNEYIREKICNKGKPKPTEAGRSLFEIKATLKKAGYRPSPHHPETRFYPT